LQLAPLAWENVQRAILQHDLNLQAGLAVLVVALLSVGGQRWIFSLHP